MAPLPEDVWAAASTGACAPDSRRHPVSAGRRKMAGRRVDPKGTGAVSGERGGRRGEKKGGGDRGEGAGRP